MLKREGGCEFISYFDAKKFFAQASFYFFEYNLTREKIIKILQIEIGKLITNFRFQTKDLFSRKAKNF